MKTIEKHRQTWQGKSNEWLFKRLDNELKQKVEEIHRLLAENEALHKSLISGSLPLSVKFLEWLHNKVTAMETDGCRFEKNKKWKIGDECYTSKEIIGIYIKESGNDR